MFLRLIEPVTSDLVIGDVFRRHPQRLLFRVIYLCVCCSPDMFFYLSERDGNSARIDGCKLVCYEPVVTLPWCVCRVSSSASVAIFNCSVMSLIAFSTTATASLSFSVLANSKAMRKCSIAASLLFCSTAKRVNDSVVKKPCNNSKHYNVSKKR